MSLVYFIAIVIFRGKMLHLQKASDSDKAAPILLMTEQGSERHALPLSLRLRTGMVLVRKH